MKSNSIEGHSIHDDRSVLEIVIDERNEELRNAEIRKAAEANKDYFAFEGAIMDDTDFKIVMIQREDDFIIRLHDYLLGETKKIMDMDTSSDPSPRLVRINDMLSQLEGIPVVQEHVMQLTMSEEEKEQEQQPVEVAPEQETADVSPDAIAALVMEKQKVRKMGPIRRYIYLHINRRKK